jgi:prevent-host-death family protein
MYIVNKGSVVKMAVKQESSGENSDLTQGQGSWFGDYEELGKTEARQQFLSLVDSISHEAKSVAITDRGKRVAVIMGYKQFQVLMDLLGKKNDTLQKNPLDGLIVKVGNLDADSEKVNALFQASVKRTTDTI